MRRFLDWLLRREKRDAKNPQTPERIPHFTCCLCITKYLGHPWQYGYPITRNYCEACMNATREVSLNNGWTP